MTSAATPSIEIDAPVEEVFAFVADPRRQTAAMARALGRRVTVADVETSPEGVVTGWSWSTRFVLPITYTAKVTRAEHVPDERIVNQHHTVANDVDTITVAPTPTGTRPTWHAELSSPIPLLEGVGDPDDGQGQELRAPDRGHPDRGKEGRRSLARQRPGRAGSIAQSWATSRGLCTERRLSRSRG